MFKHHPRIQLRFSYRSTARGGSLDCCSGGWLSTSTGTGRVVLIMCSRSMVAFEALKIPESSLENLADEAGEKGDKCKCLQSPLQPTLVDESRRVCCAATRTVVLCRKDEGCEPKIRENPGERGKVSFVRLDCR